MSFLFGNKNQNVVSYEAEYPLSLKIVNEKTTATEVTNKSGFYDLNFDVEIPSITLLFNKYLELSAEMDKDYNDINSYIDKVNKEPATAAGAASRSYSELVGGGGDPQAGGAENEELTSIKSLIKGKIFPSSKKILDVMRSIFVLYQYYFIAKSDDNYNSIFKWCDDNLKQIDRLNTMLKANVDTLLPTFPTTEKTMIKCIKILSLCLTSKDNSLGYAKQHAKIIYLPNIVRDMFGIGVGVILSKKTDTSTKRLDSLKTDTQGYKIPTDSNNIDGVEIYKKVFNTLTGSYSLGIFDSHDKFLEILESYQSYSFYGNGKVKVNLFFDRSKINIDQTKSPDAMCVLKESSQSPIEPGIFITSQEEIHPTLRTGSCANLNSSHNPSSIGLSASGTGTAAPAPPPVPSANKYNTVIYTNLQECSESFSSVLHPLEGDTLQTKFSAMDNTYFEFMFDLKQFNFNVNAIPDMISLEDSDSSVALGAPAGAGVVKAPAGAPVPVDDLLSGGATPGHAVTLVNITTTKHNLLLLKQSKRVTISFKNIRIPSNQPKPSSRDHRPTIQPGSFRLLITLDNNDVFMNQSERNTDIMIFKNNFFPQQDKVVFGLSLDSSIILPGTGKDDTEDKSKDKNSVFGFIPNNGSFFTPSPENQKIRAEYLKDKENQAKHEEQNKKFLEQEQIVSRSFVDSVTDAGGIIDEKKSKTIIQKLANDTMDDAQVRQIFGDTMQKGTKLPKLLFAIKSPLTRQPTTPENVKNNMLLLLDALASLDKNKLDTLKNTYTNTLTTTDRALIPGTGGGKPDSDNIKTAKEFITEMINFLVSKKYIDANTEAAYIGNLDAADNKLATIDDTSSLPIYTTRLTPTSSILATTDASTTDASTTDASTTDASTKVDTPKSKGANFFNSLIGKLSASSSSSSSGLGISSCGNDAHVTCDGQNIYVTLTLNTTDLLNQCGISHEEILKISGAPVPDDDDHVDDGAVKVDDGAVKVDDGAVKVDGGVKPDDAPAVVGVAPAAPGAGFGAAVVKAAPDADAPAPAGGVKAAPAPAGGVKAAPAPAAAAAAAPDAATEAKTNYDTYVKDYNTFFKDSSPPIPQYYFYTTEYDKFKSNIDKLNIDDLSNSFSPVGKA